MLGDGAAKEERDRQFAALKSNKKSVVPDKWADADIQKMIYGLDVMEAANAHFDMLYASM